MALIIRHSPSLWTERLAIVGLLFFSLVHTQLTIWKETEIFWLDVGGYPIWLREVVKTLYYPYSLFLITAALMITRSVCGRFLRELRVHRVWVLLAISLLIMSGSFGLLVANNLINVIEGRPVHSHVPKE